MAVQINIQNKTFLVPEPGDPCELWVRYFNALESSLGTSNARTLWLVTWASNGATSCTTSGSFNSWLQKNGIDVSNAATRAIADTATIGSNFLGMGKNLSKIASVAIPSIVVLLLSMIGLILWNTAKKADAGDVAALTPLGRSVGAGIKLLGK